MAAVEKDLTRDFLSQAVVCRLQADGLGRVYQVELGMLIWKLPSSLQELINVPHGYPGVRQLGDRGPWLVGRLICAREMQAELGTAGKTDMITGALLRACTGMGDSHDPTALYTHVRDTIASWASDGADLCVGNACTAHFPRMAFREWEESHSAAKVPVGLPYSVKPHLISHGFTVSFCNISLFLKRYQSTLRVVVPWMGASDGADLVSQVLEHAVRDHEEAKLIDGLLVSGCAAAPTLNFGKKPTSLAKFLSQSEVFKKRCSEAQRLSAINLCVEFGYAPQRYASRSRPLSRESRRWAPIWDSLAAEASGNGPRAQLARFFLEELGGTNSHRLLFGGMLTDIAVEHYQWIAGGGQGNPDPSHACSGHDLFMQRLKVLIDEGMILTMEDTYTGEVLRFLKKGKIVFYKSQVQSCALGNLADSEVQDRLHCFESCTVCHT